MLGITLRDSERIKLGVMKDPVHFYQVSHWWVQRIGTLRMGVKILRTHDLDIHWDQRVDTISDHPMTGWMEMNRGSWTACQW